jgi:hypothetical protein
MTKEDRELLFIDLCGRLPYGVKIQVVENYMGLIPKGLAIDATGKEIY